MTTIEDDELFNTHEKVLKLTPNEALFIDDSLTMNNASLGVNFNT